MPKPLLPVAGKPVLEHQIALAKRYGLDDIIILTGYLGEEIEQYFGDGRQLGVHIRYYQEPYPLGTAGCVKELEDVIKEDFMVFYGDTMMDIDLKQFIDFHQQHKGSASLFIHPNNHPYDSDLVEINDSAQISSFYPKPHDANQYYQNLVNAALYIFSPQVLQYIQKDIASDFGKDVFPRMLKAGEKLFGYKSTEYIKDMGTPDRLSQVEKSFRSGKMARFNKNNLRPAIFLDRDGVINQEVDLLHKLEDFQLLPRVGSAIKKINESDYLAIVVTNQPVIARGLCSFEQLRQIHNKMETILGKERAYVDEIYFCPHHPDKGYPEEVKEFKIKCQCRKPAIAMIQKAQEEYGIDLSRSFIIGDSSNDILTGQNAGIKTILVRTGYAGQDNKYDVKPDFVFDDLYEAVSYIVDNVPFKA